MMNLEQAREIAQEELNASNPNKDLLIVDQYVEFDEGWVFFYETRDMSKRAMIVLACLEMVRLSSPKTAAGCIVAGPPMTSITGLPISGLMFRPRQLAPLLFGTV